MSQAALRNIAIGVCTRGRPDGITALLNSFTRLRIPAGHQPVFIIVENEVRKSLQPVIEDFRTRIGDAEVVYETESRLGIPFVRNRVLDLALERDCGQLAFVDDDEVVDPGWLVALHAELAGRHLQLVGGPVRILPAPEKAGWLERAIWRGLVHRNIRIEETARQRHRRGRDHLVSIVTSSWLADLSFLRAQGLRFEESLGFSGGSDTLFFRHFRLKGGRSGWAPNAIVSEFWPLARLRPGYQFRRGRDQSISNFRNKVDTVTPWVLMKSFCFVLYKVLSAAALSVITLLDGGRSSVRALRAMGFSVGRIKALAGAKSAHYAVIEPG